MGEKEDMQHETYKKDKEIKKTTIEIQENVNKIRSINILIVDKYNDFYSSYYIKLCIDRARINC